MTDLLSYIVFSDFVSKADESFLEAYSCSTKVFFVVEEVSGFAPSRRHEMGRVGSFFKVIESVPKGFNFVTRVTSLKSTQPWLWHSSSLT